mgnify:CR=1 FL=1
MISNQRRGGQREHGQHRAENDQRFLGPARFIGQQHDRGNRAGPRQHRHRHGEHRDILDFRRRSDLLGPVLAPLGALLEHHFERDKEQHDAACNAEAVEFDMQCVEQILAEQREADEDDARDDHRADRHAAALGRCRALGQSGIDRGAAGRVDNDEQCDESRKEQRGHANPPKVRLRCLSWHRPSCRRGAASVSSSATGRATPRRSGTGCCPR